MSLKSLFSITLSSLLLVILATVFILNIKNTQTFIENQVYATSQDNAYSLGMSIATLKSKDNKVEIELMINAIFDSGYYEYIRFYDTNHKILYKKSMPIIVKDVPKWFINIIPINIKEATAKINRGWYPIGELVLKGSNGYAYYQLYQAFKSVLLIFSIIAIISFIILFFIINSLLYPLSRLKEQANGINEHKFIIQKKKSYINEFNILITAMNKMVKKVESIFKSEVKTFEEYQKVLYRDEETNLPNKKYFMLKLTETLHDENFNIGHLAIISIDGLQKLKNDINYDYYKKILNKIINDFPEDISKNNLIARINKNEFAILFNTNQISKIEKDFQKLQKSLSLINKELKSNEKLLCFDIGVAPYFKDDKISQAVSRVDYSLSSSKVNGCNVIDIYKEKSSNKDLITMGKRNWKIMFDKIFDENRIVLAMQEAINKNNNLIFHSEALIRIKEDDNSLQTASYYFPMASALGLISKLDHTVINILIKRVNEFENSIAININKEFVVKSIYFQELRNSLSKIRKTHPKKLHFECNENDILAELESYIEFSDMIHAHHQYFGIDRFSGIENLSYIEKIRPDYIKINVNFILDVYLNNSAILKTLNIVSKTMGTTLIITSVESREQFEKLKEIGYTNFQGRYISDIWILD